MHVPAQRRRPAPWPASSVCGLALQAAAVPAVHAQAWVPPKGEGSVSILYQDLFVEDHLRANGTREDRGQVRSQGLLFDVTYGVTDRLALSLVVPAVRARYTGKAPHPNRQDNGDVHRGFQDVRLGVRYNLVQGPVTITPFVGANMPSHAYQTFAHAAFGRRVRELEVGVYVGRIVSPRLPNAFAQARYSYSFAERIVGIHHDRSTLDVELGYCLPPSSGSSRLASVRRRMGASTCPTPAGARCRRTSSHITTVSLAPTWLIRGGGLQVSVSRSFDVFGSYMTTVAGRNGHALQRGVTVGVAWSFGQGMGLVADAERVDPTDGALPVPEGEMSDAVSTAAPTRSSPSPAGLRKVMTTDPSRI